MTLTSWWRISTTSWWAAPSWLTWAGSTSGGPSSADGCTPELLGKLSALIVFVGFNLTFFPQFVLGYLGMPRRYYEYPPEYQVLNVMSTAGASILAVGYVLPLLYLLFSLRHPPDAGPNPWHATGLEWQTESPPPVHNFDVIPDRDPRPLRLFARTSRGDRWKR